MRVISDARQTPSGCGTAVAIGNFDGVHLGHREVIGRMTAHARATGLVPVVLAFRPHPARVFAKEFAPPLITSYEARASLVAGLGVDLLVEQKFDEQFAAMSAREFLDGYLSGLLGARSVFVGFDFTFGAGGLGGTDTMREFCRGSGMFVEVVPQVRIDGLAVSSTKVREFVLEGNVAGASKLLGRPYSIDGTVVAGEARGRGLGFPTANLEGGFELVPGGGVYVTVATAGSERMGAVTNIGTNPTFGGRRTTIETHMPDYSGDLYGRPLVLEFLARLRGERLFESPAALEAQISSDVAEARRILAASGAVAGAP